jgi:hypothetical protein
MAQCQSVYYPHCQLGAPAARRYAAFCSARDSIQVPAPGVPRSISFQPCFDIPKLSVVHLAVSIDCRLVQGVFLRTFGWTRWPERLRSLGVALCVRNFAAADGLV